MAVTIKSQREIELMRESCKILADVFSQMEKAVHPGVSTLDINNLGDVATDTQHPSVYP